MNSLETEQNVKRITENFSRYYIPGYAGRVDIFPENDSDA
jgi:hypothetical protein